VADWNFYGIRRNARSQPGALHNANPRFLQNINSLSAKYVSLAMPPQEQAGERKGLQSEEEKGDRHVLGCKIKAHSKMEKMPVSFFFTRLRSE